MKNFSFILFVFLFSLEVLPQELPLPPRPADALSGSEFISLIWSMPREAREEQIYSQVISGNIPEFMRQLKLITASANIVGTNRIAAYYVIPDYLAVGSDSDYFLTPMTPILAQRICNELNCTLPTKKMVDQIYQTAPCKLRPQPIPPSDQMITVPVFAQHNDSVKTLRMEVINWYPLGTLVGGTKKDVVISNNIYQNLKPNAPKPVVIYGWHQLNGQPIQPVYNGHTETYADYSHGIRLVLDSVVVDGTPMTFTQLLADPVLSVLISDEGTILKPYYSLEGFTTPAPKTFCITWDSPNSLKITVTPAAGTTYKAFWGSDGLFFNDSTAEFNNNIIVDGLDSDSIFFFRLRAQTSQGYSLFSEVLAGVTSSAHPEVLIVNGFDRASSGNTYNFIRQHGSAFKQNGYGFCAATNEAVLQGLISLRDYSIVDYILGDESTADETFNTAEQELIKAFLRNGGKLFVSGSEVAWDLDYRGSASDKDFMYNFLKSKYVYDAPNNQAGVYYQAEPVSGSIFEGVGTISFDNGTHGTIDVRYPDVITGMNGGVNCLQYSNLTNQFAGIYFEEIFPGGTAAGKVVYIGFPFETIYPEAKRNLFLNKVISFFNEPVGIFIEADEQVSSFQLFQNYPNPFNQSTKIKYTLMSKVKSEGSFGGQRSNDEIQTRAVVLKVFDMLGREAATLVNEEKSPGTYEIYFDAGSLSSGVYYYQLSATSSGNTEMFVETKKMVILR